MLELSWREHEYIHVFKELEEGLDSIDEEEETKVNQGASIKK